MHHNSSRYSLNFLFAIVAVFAMSQFAAAQSRDFLTETEADLVRANQILDKRIEVYIKTADRRFAVINGTVSIPTKKSQKEDEKWGEAPTGSRAQLLSDIAGILDAAISNIDDVSQHDEKNPLIPRSLRKLAASANGYMGQLNTLRTQSKDADELAAIERALENASQIVEAGNKLPAASTEKEKKKKN